MRERRGEERREERREKEGWITLRRAVTRCAVLCCGYIYIYFIYCLKAVTLYNVFLLHVAVSSTS